MRWLKASKYYPLPKLYATLLSQKGTRGLTLAARLKEKFPFPLEP